MKKFYSLVLVGVLGITTMFGQGFGASLDYAMWNGAMTDTSENPSSIIIGVSYTHNLSAKMDLVGSAGYGIGFDVVPLKADLKYSITNKLSANLGMGMYMISDEVYDANAIGVLVDGSDAGREEKSTNEFGINLGLGYQITSALSLGFNYNMIKSGDYDFNGMQFGLAYSFGGNSEEKDKKVPAKSAPVKEDKKAAKEKAAQEKASKEKASKEKASKEKAAQEKAAKEKAAQEKAAQEKAAQEKAAQEKAAKEDSPE